MYAVIVDVFFRPSLTSDTFVLLPLSMRECCFVGVIAAVCRLRLVLEPT